MAKVDEILQELSNTVFQHGKATRTNIPFHYGEPMKDAKQALYKDMLELIGEDDTEVRGTTQNSTNPKYWTKRTKTKNELRQELRNKLKEYFGITE